MCFSLFLLSSDERSPYRSAANNATMRRQFPLPVLSSTSFSFSLFIEHESKAVYTKHVRWRTHSRIDEIGAHSRASRCKKVTGPWKVTAFYLRERRVDKRGDTPADRDYRESKRTSERLRWLLLHEREKREGQAGVFILALGQRA